MKTVILLLSLSFCVSEVEAAKAPRISALKTLESYTVPAIEISGMAWRTNPKTKNRDLILVSDREHQLFIVDWTHRKKEFKVETIDLKPLEKATGVDTQSEWESVFSDESGRIFIVRETPAQIVVVSADLQKIEKTLDLPGFEENANAGPEGMLPLSNGHVLIVKEKNPLRVMEFAPTGSKAEGYRPELSIEKKGIFPFAKDGGLSLKHVHTWHFSPENEELFEDSSGLNADGKGTLYLLGDQQNLIGRIGKNLKTNKEKLKLSQLWSIPSELKQPEGMVVDDENRPIIAIDQKKTKNPNLFLLSPLE